MYRKTSEWIYDQPFKRKFLRHIHSVIHSNIYWTPSPRAMHQSKIHNGAEHNNPPPLLKTSETAEISTGMGLRNHLPWWFSVPSSHQEDQLFPEICLQTLPEMTFWVRNSRWRGGGGAAIQIKPFGWSRHTLRIQNHQPSLIIFYLS